MKYPLGSKYMAVVLIFAFLLFYCPYFLTAKDEKEGKLVGFVYDKDGTSPVKGAVVKVKNIRDGSIFESGESDIHGAFKIEGLKLGLYYAGIETANGKFDSNGLIGIKNKETSKVAFALIPPQEEEKIVASYLTKELPPKNELRIGKVIAFNADLMEAKVFMEEGTLRVGDNVRFKGLVTDFYQKVREMKIDDEEVRAVIAGQTPVIKVEDPTEVGDFVYLVLKKKGFFAVLWGPCGLAALLTGAAAFVLGGEVLEEEEEEERSPFRH